MKNENKLNCNQFATLCGVNPATVLNLIKKEIIEASIFNTNGNRKILIDPKECEKVAKWEADRDPKYLDLNCGVTYRNDAMGKECQHATMIPSRDI